MLCSAGFATLVLLAYAVPHRQIKQDAAQELARKWFPHAEFKSAQLKEESGAWHWHLRFTEPHAPNLHLLVINAATRELARLTRWPESSPATAPRFVSP